MIGEMADVELFYEQLPYVHGNLLDLTDDWPSCQLFLAATLDHATQKTSIESYSISQLATIV